MRPLRYSEKTGGRCSSTAPRQECCRAPRRSRVRRRPRPSFVRSCRRRPPPSRATRRHDRAAQGPEVLRAEWTSGERTHVGVHVTRREGNAPTAAPVAQQRRARAAESELLDEGGQLGVVHAQVGALAALRRERQADEIALDRGIPALEGREAATAVRDEVPRVPDPGATRSSRRNDTASTRSRSMSLRRSDCVTRARARGRVSARSRARENLPLSCRFDQSAWYVYWRRPASSVPTAWMCALGSRAIHTSRHAGGMTRPRARSASRSGTAAPVWSTKRNPDPERTRR